jgi:hypothetical protein
MFGAFLVAVGMVVLGGYLVHVETTFAVHTGQRKPLLRNVGQLLAVLGGLCLLGFLIGR